MAMHPGSLEAADFKGSYARWAAGDCPCCGWLEADSPWDETQPMMIGEGVMICGRCVANEHGREDGQFFPMMLEAIARRL